MRFGKGVKGAGMPWVRDIISKTLAAEKQKNRRVSVFVAQNREIRRLNREYLKHDTATDVISFGLDGSGLNPKETGHLGDVAVSAEMARAVSKKLGISFKEELARYLVHGTLHLLGYEDKNKKDRIKMHGRQEAILKYVIARSRRRRSNLTGQIACPSGRRASPLRGSQ